MLCNGSYETFVLQRACREDASVPKIVDHDQRRAEIVTATWKTLAAEGIDGTTMRRIAEAAGCSTGRLTHYFPSREAILIEALRAVHLAAAQRMTAVAAEHRGLDALSAVVHEALPLDGTRRREWKVWLAFWGQAAATRSLRREHERRYAEWRALIAGLLASAVDAGELRALDVDLEAGRLIALIDGLGIQCTLERGPDRLATSLGIVEAHLASLSKSPRT
jgi:TetR/AcrR family transcriptional repressor of bet genes